MTAPTAAREGEPERAPARGPPIARRAQDETGDRAAGLRGGDEEPGADLVEAEPLDREERQVAQHRALDHAEHEAGGEEDDQRGPARPPPGRRRLPRPAPAPRPAPPRGGRGEGPPAPPPPPRQGQGPRPRPAAAAPRG